MFGSGVLDTAIGVVFVFLLVSMLVTIANEIISAALLSRAKWLRIGIDRLLGSTWARQLYEHPLISGSAQIADSKSPNQWNPRGSGPSYIPSRSFANVLLDLVRRGDATVQAAQEKLRAALDGAQAPASPDALKRTVIAAAENMGQSATVGTALAEDLRRQLQKLSGGSLDRAKLSSDLKAGSDRLNDPALASLKTALQQLATQAATLPVDDLRKGLQTAIDSLPYVAVADAIRKDLTVVLERLKPGYTVGDARADIQRFIDSMPARYLREAIGKFPDEQVRKTLLVLLDDAENDIEKFKSNIEVWFNNAMDRVGGWYKRRSQWVIAGLSVTVAVAMNVDTLVVIKHLDTYPGVRNALVEQAKAFAASSPASAARQAASGAAGEPRPDVQFSVLETKLMELSLPIGWVRDTPTRSATESEKVNRQLLPAWGDCGAWRDTIFFHFLGWLLTALAATLGAPFWFDTLNRFISIRSAGKAPEEMPKPPKDVPVPLEPGQSPREADLASGRRN